MAAARAVRGAIQVGGNDPRLIEEASVRLVGDLLRENHIRETDIVSILFSVTGDLSAANPAAALRRGSFGRTPLFCLQEAAVEGGMPRVIRVLVTWNLRGWRALRPHEPAVPVYLDGAKALRPDLAR